MMRLLIDCDVNQVNSSGQNLVVRCVESGIKYVGNYKYIFFQREFDLTKISKIYKTHPQAVQYFGALMIMHEMFTG